METKRREENIGQRVKEMLAISPIVENAPYLVRDGRDAMVYANSGGCGSNTHGCGRSRATTYISPYVGMQK